MVNWIDESEYDIFKEVLKYNSETGVLTWRVAGRGRALGSVAGSKSTRTDHLQLIYNRKTYQVHRIAFYLYWDYLPKQPLMIDHRDNRADNNCIDNLRVATRSQNAINRVFSKTNPSGQPNVRKHSGGKWQVCLSIEGKETYFGLYSNLSDATEVSVSLRKTHYGEFASDNRR